MTQAFTTDVLGFISNSTYLILCIIGKWLILDKMGEEGWKALIPFYSEYLVIRNIWSGSAFWAELITGVLAIVDLVASVVFIDEFSPVFWAVFAGLGFFLLLVNFVINVRISCKLAIEFGHGIGYTLGLIFLRPIFLLMLGLTHNQFYGKQVQF